MRYGPQSPETSLRNGLICDNYCTSCHRPDRTKVMLLTAIQALSGIALVLLLFLHSTHREALLYDLHMLLHKFHPSSFLFFSGDLFLQMKDKILTKVKQYSQ